MPAATIIPDRLRGNPRNFIFLDLQVDADFDRKSFMDLLFSFRQNHTLRYVTLVRTSPDELAEKNKQRSIKELRMLVREIMELPRLELLEFEGFTEEFISQFDDLLLGSITRVQ